MRQFQCCICAFMLALFVMALVVSISYSISRSAMNNSTISDLPPNLVQSTGLRPNSNSYSSDSIPTSLSEEEIIEGIQAGNEAIQNRILSDATTKPLPSPSPDFRHQFAVSTSLKAGELALAGIAEIAATKKIESARSSLGKPSSMGSYFNGGWAPQGSCKEFTNITCRPRKFRTYDGTCNNPNQWGSALSPYRRILPPAYADGISSPRRAVSGKSLPSAREVSLKVHPPSPSANPSFTVMLAVFGQFLDHDITATAASRGINGSSLSCCRPVNDHPECFPVEVGPGDPVYDVGGKSCMEFVRSAPAPQCKIGPRQQLNQVTAFIDGSTIYGSDSLTASSLREFKGGHLRMQVTSDNRTLLPPSKNLKDGCNRDLELKRGRYCFAAGDGRANENLHLTTMHVIWARQHNKLADELLEINPSWDDETLYQESRRIVGAQLQHIAYTEFLPIILGETETNSINLKPLKSGFRKANTTVNPGLANNFAAAAFRFAHTLLPGLMRITDVQTGTSSYIELHRMLFNPYSLYSHGGVAESVIMATSNVIQKTSTHVTSQLTSHLFEDPTSNKTVPCGLDLVSLNIQRGRDHGLPGYTKWRKYCGLTEPDTFFDLKSDLDPDALDAISKLYSSVHDIDLYTGALAEIPKSDGIVGPTFTCLIGEQFKRLQQGDTFWYENDNQSGSFSGSQLKELRKTSLAKVICDCSDGITQIQPEVMRSEKITNRKISCEVIPRPSLEAWRKVPSLRVEQLVEEKPIEDWLTFKRDINRTLQDIVNLIKISKPLPFSQDYLTFQKELNQSFTDLRNELAGLHPKQNPPETNSLNDFKTHMIVSLKNASDQIPLLFKKPSVIGDWAAFKTQIIKSLNNSIANFKASSPQPADWIVFKSEIKDQVTDIRKQIAAIKENPMLQEIVGSPQDTDLISFKADIIKSVNGIVDKIKDTMPQPGDPNWATYVQNVKAQFSNFRDQIAHSGLRLSLNSSPSFWKNTRRDLEKSLNDAITNIDSNKSPSTNLAWLSHKDAIKDQMSLHKATLNDDSPEWLKFKIDLSKTIDRIVQNIENNAPPPGDPAWTDYKMKIMNQFASFRKDIPMKSKVLLKISPDGTVFDWMALKTDLNESLSELINEKKAGKLLSHDSKLIEFRNNLNKSLASSEYRITVLQLNSEENFDSDWENFRKDLANSVKEIVQYIKDNAPPPGSPDWVEFKKDIKNKFIDLKNQIDLKKSEISLKLTDTGTMSNDIDIDRKNFELDGDRESDWFSFKHDLNTTLIALIGDEDPEKLSSGDPGWTKFINHVNKSIAVFKNNIADLPPKPQGKLLWVLQRDWSNFSKRVNKSFTDAISNIEISKLSPEDPAWETFKDFVIDNLTELKDQIAEIRAEWKSNIEGNVTEELNTDIPVKTNLGSLQPDTKKAFSDVKSQVENLKLDPIPFDVTDPDWVSFKEMINKTLENFINAINRSDTNDWIKFRDFVNMSIVDLKNEVNALKNVTDEAVQKIQGGRNSTKIISQDDWNLFKTEINRTIAQISDNLSNSNSSMINSNIHNTRKGLVNIRKKILSLPEQQFSQTNSQSYEDWTIFSKELNNSVVDIKKKVQDLKPDVDNSKWMEYQNLVEEQFEQLDNVVKNKKEKLQAIMASSASRTNLKFLDQIIWLGFVSVAIFERL